ncbi:replicative helicase loader/inhibitor [Sediminimonas sp.]|uniref:replicative helicase loader/inhibitor n=1 Tax=Sediminimonas sp. TaxID=2823379 RepID=UPI0025F193BA|nr:replicative helicase loader/inhibitor [Sediminimonas sp.]
MVALEQEVMAKKFDRFGWERDMGSPAHDRMITDWMDMLQDYPLHEVQAACRQWVANANRKMPTEGDILRLIKAERARRVAEFRRNLPSEPPTAAQDKKPTPEEANAIVEAAGYPSLRMPKAPTE